MQQYAYPPATLRQAIVRLVQRDDTDLSTLQLAVLLISTEEDGPHTVRGLAARLNVAKPAISRAVDRLEQYGLTQRMEDTRDRRSVLIVSTGVGTAFVADLAAMPATAANGCGQSVTALAAAAG